LLRELNRVFNKDYLKSPKGDVFGRIYEYFLMNFSMVRAGAKWGPLFTPRDKGSALNIWAIS
jgi:type I restriction enzyme M protein